MSRKIKSFSTTDELAEKLEEEAAAQSSNVSSIVNQALREYLGRQKAPTDSWSTRGEEDWYDERKFYTFAEDKKGHSVTVRVVLPKNLAGQIARVIGAGRIPEYRSANDLYRDAVFHRARKVAQWIDDDELKHEVDLQILIAEELMIQQKKDDASELQKQMTVNLEDAFSRKDYGWIAVYIDERMDRLDLVPQAFQAQMREMLNRYQGRLESETGKKLRVLKQGQRKKIAEEIA